MKELSTSRSSYYKSQAGTAYSVTKRLLGFGFIEQGTDGHIATTQAGVDQLMAWLSPPIPQADIAHSADMIRLRFFFLGAIEQDQRLAFIDDAIAGLRSFLVECKDLIRANEEIGDYFGALATVSTVLEARARIQWLEMVRMWVMNPIDASDGWAATILKALE